MRAQAVSSVPTKHAMLRSREDDASDEGSGSDSGGSDSDNDGSDSDSDGGDSDNDSARSTSSGRGTKRGRRVGFKECASKRACVGKDALQQLMEAPLDERNVLE